MIAFALNPKNPNNTLHLPTDAKERKAIPLFSGLINYFPDALVAIAKLSQAGNDQHNPGQPLHWAREKSSDHEDTLVRHLFDSGTIDVDGHRHSTKVAWRALAILQLEIEKEKQAEAKKREDEQQQKDAFGKADQAGFNKYPNTGHPIQAQSQYSDRYQGGQVMRTRDGYIAINECEERKPFSL